MENAFPAEGASLTETNAWRRRGLMAVRLEHGRQKGPALLASSHRREGWTAPVKALRFTPSQPAFTATMKARFDSGWFNYEFSGLHICDRIAGKFKIKRRGRVVCEGVFTGALDVGKPIPPGYRLNEEGVLINEYGDPVPDPLPDGHPPDPYRRRLDLNNIEHKLRPPRPLRPVKAD
jgi:hypothetical protein